MCRAVAGTPEDEVGYRCDDPSDCKPHEACCRLFERVWVEHATCVGRKAIHRCQAELCAHEGGKCPSHMTCSATSPAEDGTCDAPPGPATCGDKKRCPKDQPVCIQGPKGLRCVAFGSDDFKAVTPEHRFWCTRQEDCAPEYMCFFAFGEATPEPDRDMRTYCGRGGPAYLGTLVCDPRTKQRSGDCQPDRELPSWMGHWQL